MSRAKHRKPKYKARPPAPAPWLLYGLIDRAIGRDVLVPTVSKTACIEVGEAFFNYPPAGFMMRLRSWTKRLLGS